MQDMKNWTAVAALAAMAALSGAPDATASGATGTMFSAHKGGQPPRIAPQGFPVKVYFSKHPISDDRFGAVFPVRRVSPTLGVATFAISQLIAGPGPVEARAGYFTEITPHYFGPSNCGPNGFTIALNRRGAMFEPGTATIRFCRFFALPGLGAGARITAEVHATLLQFSSIKRVVMLNRNGDCFNDLSGLNRCLGSGGI
jgi:hypothetical protein